MANAFNRGQQLTWKDLNITLRNSAGQSIDAFSITYVIVANVCGRDQVIGSLSNDPVHRTTGFYFANWKVLDDAPITHYKIIWQFKYTENSEIMTHIEPFSVVDSVLATTGIVNTLCENAQRLLLRLRRVLRDNNPDRNYRFAPPSSENQIQSYSEIFGFLFEDEELLEFLDMAVESINQQPPLENYDICSLPRNLGFIAVTGAAAYALSARGINWLVDQFSYSIGGISLDLSGRSDQYGAGFSGGAAASMKEAFQNSIEQHKASIKLMRGLAQPRFGIGISAHLGPHNKSGIVSPRNYASFRTTAGT